MARRIVDSPPRVHPNAPNGAVWRTGWRCYEFMAQQVAPGDRTLETGTGISTVMFAAWGCEHVAIVPSEHQATIIQDYCREMSIDTGGLQFDLRPSELALPAMAGGPELDLVFVDGAHGFPLPTIDWFYGAGRLRRGGIVVFDDVQRPAVKQLLDLYLERDPRWKWVGGKSVWKAYRRLSEGPLDGDELGQPFFHGTPLHGWVTLRAMVGATFPPGLRQRLSGR